MMLILLICCDVISCMHVYISYCFVPDCSVLPTVCMCSQSVTIILLIITLLSSRTRLNRSTKHHKCNRNVPAPPTHKLSPSSPQPPLKDFELTDLPDWEGVGL